MREPNAFSARKNLKEQQFRPSCRFLRNMSRLTTPLVLILMVVFFAGGYSARETYKSRYETVTAHLPAVRMTAYAESARTDVGRRSDIDLRPRETFMDVLRLLQQQYVEQIQDSHRKDLAYGALRSMLDSLKDPYTRFLAPEQKQLAEEAREGRFRGLGTAFGFTRISDEYGTYEQLVVVSALPGSSGQKAGLQPGDIITEIDGKTVLPYNPFQKTEKLIKAQRSGEISREDLLKLWEVEDKRIKDGISFQTAGDMLSAPFKDSIELTIDRGGKTVKAKVESADVEVDPVSHLIKDGVGTLDINIFTPSAEAQVASALADMQKKSVTKLVIDLRGNPGGCVETAKKICGFFSSDKGFAVLADSKGGRQTIKTPSVGEAKISKVWSQPLVVMVDGGTASAAELFAGALRDNHDAKLIGTHTFGHALEVTMLPQRDGSAVELTTGKFLTPKGIDFHIKGLKVDSEVEGAEAQVARAKELVMAG